MKKRLFAIVLAMCLMVSLLPTTAMAVEFEDTNGHWGEAAVNRWANIGVVRGDGTNFFPDKEMTRAEMAMVLANLLGLTTVGDNKFADVDADAWYAEAILKCAAAGIMKGDGVNANPNGKLTREEATVLVGRALGIQPVEGKAQFNDGSKVSDWASGYVNAMSEKGIIQGVGNNTFAPANNINRASVVTILNESISTYVNTPGEKVEATGEGITLIAAPNVTVTGKVEDMVVGAGAQGSSVTMEKTTVSGTLTVAAADTTVTLKANTTTASVVVTETAEQSKVVVEKAAQVGTLTAAAPKAEVSVAGKVETVATTGTAAETKVEVQKDAQVGTLTAAAPKAEVSVAGKVETVATTGTAAETKVEVKKDAQVGTLTAAAPKAEVTVAGKVETVATTDTAAETKVEVQKNAQVGTLTAAAPKAEVSVAGKVETVATTGTAAETKVEVKKDAVVGEVAIAGEKTDVTVAGKVENVTVSDSAANTKVEAAEGSTITKVDNAAAGTTITGSGKVENVTTSGDNTKVETGGTKVEVAEDTKGTTVGDKEVTGGSTTTTEPTEPSKPSTGGGGGGYVHYHSWVDSEVLKEATCTEDGSKKQTCSCGAEQTVVIPALGHDYAEVVTAPTCTEQGYTTHTCSRCNDSYVDSYVDALGHDLTEATTTPATCTEAGSKTITCSRCDYSKTEEIPALGHNFKTEWSKNESGHWHACDRCDVANVEAHDYGTGDTCVVCAYERNHVHRLTLVPAVEPTCTTDGNTAYYTCSGCDVWFTDAAGNTQIEEHGSVIIAALGHDYAEVVTAPTCTEQGYTTHTCSRCNDSYVDSYVPALGHDWNDGEVTKAPTCTEPGVKTFACQREGCDETKTETIAALGHDYENGFCTRCGDMVMTKGDTIDNALMYLLDYVITSSKCGNKNIRNYVSGYTTASGKDLGTDRNIVIKIKADVSDTEDFDSLQAAFKDGWSAGDYSNLKWETITDENGLPVINRIGLYALKTVSVYNTADNYAGTFATLENIPSMLDRLDDASVNDIKNVAKDILEKEVQPMLDNVHIKNIGMSINLGELVTVTSETPVKVSITDRSGNVYYYTIQFAKVQAN